MANLVKPLVALAHDDYFAACNVGEAHLHMKVGEGDK